MVYKFLLFIYLLLFKYYCFQRFGFDLRIIIYFYIYYKWGKYFKGFVWSKIILLLCIIIDLWFVKYF